MTGLASSEIHNGWDVAAAFALLVLIIVLFWAANR